MSFLKTLNSPIVDHTLLAGSLAGVHFSPAVSSICLLLFVLLSISKWWFVDTPSKSKFRWYQWSFLGLLMLFFSIDGFNSHSLLESFKNLQVVLPFFAMPSILFSAIHRKTPWSKVWYLYSLPLIWVILPVAVNYWNNQEFLSQMVLESKPLPLYTQVYHIEFSLLITAVLLFLSVLWIEKKEIRSTFFIINYALLWLGLHLISARTGLLGYWLGIGILLLKNRSYLRTKWVLSLSAILIVCFWVVPSLRNRIVNSYRDIHVILVGGDLNHKSFGQRVEAWKATTGVIERAPNTGIGSIDFNATLMQSYSEMGTRLRPSNWIGPHNQWLQWMAEYGIWAVVLVVLAIAGLFKKWPNNSYKWLWMMPMFFASNFESILERQAGVLAVLSLLFLLAQINPIEKEEKVLDSVVN